MKIKSIKFISSLILIGSVLFAQEEEPRQIPLFDLQNKKYQSSMEKYIKERSIIQTITPQVLETRLNEVEYVVGPGDLFRIHVFGEIENTFTFSVLPEGNVLIPTVGSLEVSGDKLPNVKKDILKAVKKSYKNAEISVNLTGLRKFRIYLTGEVLQPGTYFAQATDRLSDILEVSAMATKDRPTQEEAEQTGERAVSGLNDWANETAVQIRHKNGVTDTVDLTRFYRNGDKSHNPHLSGGDVIYVPSINLTQAYVSIEGNVGYQGIYPLRNDETLYEFLRRVQALNKKSNLQNIILVRDSQRKTVDFINDAASSMDLQLQNNDQIVVPTTYDRVYVRGEVFNPGSHPFLANYKARDYIGRAGALDTASDIEDVVVIRHETGEILKGADVLVHKGDTVVLPKRGREVLKDYISIIAPIASMFIATLALIAR
ncbi:MAG: hypothetical protein GF313_09515 [Caldithrix sp.]|nr:hypothetical protein [Caldithrix sp.]